MILLHLIGVSTHFRPNLSTFIQRNATGIQGVHPSSILLEISDPSPQDVDEIMHLHWLQDLQDQKCLGPMGSWAECGDSAMWRIIPSNRRHARRRQWIRWATEEEDVDTKIIDRPHAYALQLVDYIDSILMNNSVQNRSMDALALTDDFQRRECLSRRRKDNTLVMVSCAEDRAWYWKVNENGILHFDKPLRGSRSDSRQSTSRKRLLNKIQTLDCLWRNNSETMLHPCDGRIKNHDREADHQTGKAVQVQFVRLKQQQRVFSGRNAEIRLASAQKIKRKDAIKKSGEQFFDSKEPTSSASAQPLLKKPPSQVDIAHVHASTVNSDQKERRSAARSTTFLPHQSPDLVAKELPRLLGYSNPILVVSEERPKHRPESASKQGSHSSVVRDSSSVTEKPLVRKIQMNPYIASSRDERWTDPQTGLVYYTDLCRYLGHEHREAGRHTLTGVGQYTKTMLNIKVSAIGSVGFVFRFTATYSDRSTHSTIKVYGVGFFVSKRDILADPMVEHYASHSSEELRESPEFFEILRKMDGFSSGSGPAGKFDRTLFLKTNMQLSTDTMRSSLDADWRMLTQEAKDLLIGSSMKTRPAGEETLKIIESASDNPNRCSCAQIAPDDYNADPSCCARGTELVFTWRKNGNLEVRKSWLSNCATMYEATSHSFLLSKFYKRFD